MLPNKSNQSDVPKGPIVLPEPEKRTVVKEAFPDPLPSQNRFVFQKDKNFYFVNFGVYRQSNGSQYFQFASEIILNQKYINIMERINKECQGRKLIDPSYKMPTYGVVWQTTETKGTMTTPLELESPTPPNQKDHPETCEGCILKSELRIKNDEELRILGDYFDEAVRELEKHTETKRNLEKKLKNTMFSEKLLEEARREFQEKNKKISSLEETLREVQSQKEGKLLEKMRNQKMLLIDAHSTRETELEKLKEIIRNQNEEICQMIETKEDLTENIRRARIEHKDLHQKNKALRIQYQTIRTERHRGEEIYMKHIDKSIEIHSGRIEELEELGHQTLANRAKVEFERYKTAFNARLDIITANQIHLQQIDTLYLLVDVPSFKKFSSKLFDEITAAILHNDNQRGDNGNRVAPPTLQRADDGNRVAPPNIQQDEQEKEHECPLCFASMLHGKVLACWSCKNKSHESCVRKWLQKKSTCLFCRIKWVDPVDFPPLSGS
ncbi:Protein CBG00059 [Caenorhabditis briggsae]|uniref:Protein CBG00059 n=1 Tax=Caenorhabditis briggsae TaxID=6238 RepID=A8WM80_CAEBR|nr:Protein CBG00059 [Caenorhabditis briggsae]CAP21584.1 Protein CBG00059 [Caenorhabditis briggsae]